MMLYTSATTVPSRGYGQSAMLLLFHLNESEPWKSSLEDDVTGPAKAQFEGQGSFGNGAAMRVAPVALFHAADNLEDVVSENVDTNHADLMFCADCNG